MLREGGRGCLTWGGPVIEMAVQEMPSPSPGVEMIKPEADITRQVWGWTLQSPVPCVCGNSSPRDGAVGLRNRERRGASVVDPKEDSSVEWKVCSTTFFRTGTMLKPLKRLGLFLALCTKPHAFSSKNCWHFFQLSLLWIRALRFPVFLNWRTPGWATERF